MSKRARKLLHKQIMARAAMRDIVNPPLVATPQPMGAEHAPVSVHPFDAFLASGVTALSWFAIAGVVVWGGLITLAFFVVFILIVWCMIAVPLGLA